MAITTSMFRTPMPASQDEMSRLDPRLHPIAQYAKDTYGVPVISSYRSPSYNAQVGGATNSQHKLGTALDFDLSGLTEEKKKAFLDDMLSKEGIFEPINGVGGYGKDLTSFHGDLRNGLSVAWGPNHSRSSLGQLPAYAEERLRNWMGEEMPPRNPADAQAQRALFGTPQIKQVLGPNADQVKASTANDTMLGKGYAPPFQTPNDSALGRGYAAPAMTPYDPVHPVLKPVETAFQYNPMASVAQPQFANASEPLRDEQGQVMASATANMGNTPQDQEGGTFKPEAPKDGTDYLAMAALLSGLQPRGGGSQPQMPAAPDIGGGKYSQLLPFKGLQGWLRS